MCSESSCVRISKNEWNVHPENPPKPSIKLWKCCQSCEQHTLRHPCFSRIIPMMDLSLCTLLPGAARCAERSVVLVDLAGLWLKKSVTTGHWRTFLLNSQTWVDFDGPLFFSKIVKWRTISAHRESKIRKTSCWYVDNFQNGFHKKSRVILPTSQVWIFICFLYFCGFFSYPCFIINISAFHKFSWRLYKEINIVNNSCSPHSMKKFWQLQKNVQGSVLSKSLTLWKSLHFWSAILFARFGTRICCFYLLRSIERHRYSLYIESAIHIAFLISN